MKTILHNIKIGVLDVGVDKNHDDLDIHLNNWNTIFPSKMEHGTHVAGIIGAKFNKKGVNGVVRQADLYGYVLHGLLWPDSTTDTTYSKGLESLVQSGCKIINVSLGYTRDLMKDSASPIPYKRVNQSALYSFI